MTTTFQKSKICWRALVRILHRSRARLKFECRTHSPRMGGHHSRLSPLIGNEMVRLWMSMTTHLPLLLGPRHDQPDQLRQTAHRKQTCLRLLSMSAGSPPPRCPPPGPPNPNRFPLGPNPKLSANARNLKNHPRKRRPRPPNVRRPGNYSNSANTAHTGCSMVM